MTTHSERSRLLLQMLDQHTTTSDTCHVTPDQLIKLASVAEALPPSAEGKVVPDGVKIYVAAPDSGRAADGSIRLYPFIGEIYKVPCLAILHDSGSTLVPLKSKHDIALWDQLTAMLNATASTSRGS